MSRDPQRGGGYFKAVVWILILVALIYVSFRVVPVYLNNYQLEDAIKSEALYATYQRKAASDIRKTIYTKARDIGIQQIRQEDIRVETAQGMVSISVSYTVPIEFPGYTWNLNFNTATTNRAP